MIKMQKKIKKKKKNKAIRVFIDSLYYSYEFRVLTTVVATGNYTFLKNICLLLVFVRPALTLMYVTLVHN